MKVRLLASASLFVLSLAATAETNAVLPAAIASATNAPAAAPEEIQITATRIATPQEKSPTSTTVITREQIERSQSHFVTDLLRGQTGVEIARSGQAGAVEGIFLRGANNNQTLVLVDGIRVNSPFNNQYDFGQMAVDNVERIEVLRGPQSALYGSEAAGGVINIVTRRGTCLPTGWVETEGGSFNSVLTHGGFSDSLGQFSVAGDGSYASSDNDRINSDFQQYHFDGHARYDFSDRFSATLLTTYFHNRDGSASDIYTQDPTARLRTENALGGLSLRAEPTAWWDARLTLSYSHERGTYDQPGNAQNFFTDDFSRTLARRKQADFQNVFTLTEQHKILLGGTFEAVSADMTDDGTYGPSVLAQSLDSRSVYGQYDFTPVERVTLTAGGRVDDSSVFGTHETYRFGGRFTAPETETIFRSSLGTAFRAPSISDLYYPGFSNPNLKPETSLGWDAGVEQPFLDNRLRLGATFFHNHFNNLIQYVGAPLFAPENVGRAQTFGVETFGAAQILTNLTARMAYTWLDAENLDTGRALIRRPEHQLSASLNWRILPQVQAEANCLFAGRRADYNFTAPGLPYNVLLPSYAKVNLAVRWQMHQHAELFARAENLTNVRYEEVFGYPLLGRGFYGGLRLQF